MPQPLGESWASLVKGEDLALHFKDVAPGTAAHTKSTHLQFGDRLDTHVISYCPYHHRSLALLARKLHLPDHPRKGQKGSVGATHEQPLQHHLVEGGHGSSGWKPVQLDQQA